MENEFADVLVYQVQRTPMLFLLVADFKLTLLNIYCHAFLVVSLKYEN